MYVKIFLWRKVNEDQICDNSSNKVFIDWQRIIDDRRKNIQHKLVIYTKLEFIFSNNKKVYTMNTDIKTQEIEQVINVKFEEKANYASKYIKCDNLEIKGYQTNISQIECLNTFIEK